MSYSWHTDEAGLKKGSMCVCVLNLKCESNMTISDFVIYALKTCDQFIITNNLIFYLNISYWELVVIHKSLS